MTTASRHMYGFTDGSNETYPGFGYEPIRDVRGVTISVGTPATTHYDLGRGGPTLHPGSFFEDLPGNPSLTVGPVSSTVLGGLPARQADIGTTTEMAAYPDLHMDGDALLALAFPGRLIVAEVDEGNLVAHIWAATDEELAEWLPTATEFVDTIAFVEQPPAPAVEGPPQAVGGGPLMTWTEVVLDERSLKLPDPVSPDRADTWATWLGDRFILVDERAGAVSTSTDGVVWEVHEPDDPASDFADVLQMGSIATWKADIVGWDPEAAGPGSVRVIRAGEPVTESGFEGRVGAVGFGPSGIVARIHSALDFDAFITSLVGPGWVERMVTFGFEDGILRITTDDDRVLEVIWAEHGLDPGDVADRGFGWHSPDGQVWAPIAGFPENVSEIVGIPTGFIARGHKGRCDGCEGPGDPWGMWHSPDGLTWRQIGPATEGMVLRWGEGALVTDGTRRFDLWTATGVAALRFAAELPVPSRLSDPAVGAGPLGIVSVDIDEEQVLFTPDGVEWSIQAMPDEMVDDGGGRRPPSVAVGADSVLVVLLEGVETPVLSLWLGTVAASR